MARRSSARNISPASHQGIRVVYSRNLALLHCPGFLTDSLGGAGTGEGLRLASAREAVNSDSGRPPGPPSGPPVFGGTIERTPTGAATPCHSQARFMRLWGGGRRETGRRGGRRGGGRRGGGRRWQQPDGAPGSGDLRAPSPGTDGLRDGRGTRKARGWLIGKTCPSNYPQTW